MHYSILKCCFVLKISKNEIIIICINDLRICIDHLLQSRNSCVVNPTGLGFARINSEKKDD